VNASLAVPVVAIAVALVSVVPFVGAASIWDDESMTLAFARLPLPTLWTALHHKDAEFLLYYSFMHEWLRFGASAVALRVPSTLAFVAVLPIAYSIARRLLGARAAAVATLLLAVNPFLIRYAKEGRPYTLAFLLAACATLFFLKLLESPTRANAAGYVLFGALAVYAHAFCALVLIAHAVSAAVLPRAPGAARTLSWSLGCIVVLCAPLLLLVESTGVRRLGWIQRPALGDWFNLALQLLGGGAMLVAATFACGAAFGAARVQGSRAALVAVALWGAIPVALTALISYGYAPFLVPRYLIFCCLPLTLLTAAGVCALKRPALVIGVTFVLALFCEREAWSQSQYDPYDYRAAVRFVAARAAPDDVVVAPVLRFAVEAAAAERSQRDVPAVVFPSATWAFWNGPPQASAFVPALVAHAGTVWLFTTRVHRHAPFITGPEHTLAEHFTWAGDTYFGGICVIRYVRRR
jgi:mannosyltransferase